MLKTAITATAFLIAGTAIASADNVENRQDRQASSDRSGPRERLNYLA